MVYREALNGNGFGIDEFNANGTYSRKRLHTSCTIVLKDDSDILHGAMFVGQPQLCRSRAAPVLGVYVVVPENTYQRELSLVLYGLAKELARHHRCQGVLTDLFHCNHHIIEIATVAGFSFIGCIPNSAYVNGHGHCDSMLMYNKFIKKLSPKKFIVQSNI